MSEKQILPLLTLILFMIFSGVAGGQVPVEVSGQKIVTGGKVYYMHHVLQGQTLYSISRAYKVTIEAITGNNVISRGGIQTDQILKIPAAPGLAAEQPKPQSQPQVKAQAQPQARTQLPVQEKPQVSQKTQPQARTKLPVQEQPQVPQKTQPQAQPGTQAATISDTAIKEEKATPKPQAPVQTQSQSQPKADEGKPVTKPAQAEGNKSHKVKKGESISSIARKYGVSERDIRKANKGLLFPMPGMYLVIPVKGDDKSEEETEK
jgi:LysM repeat protein